MDTGLLREAALISLADFAAAHGVPLTRFAYLLCGDRGLAEDLVQDAFSAIYRRFGSSETTLAELPDVPTETTFPDEHDAMWRALATLPERQRGDHVVKAIQWTNGDGSAPYIPAQQAIP